MATSDRQNRVASGSVAGTGAAINIVVGFIPTYVEVFNIASASKLVWMDGMPAAAGIKTVTAGTQTYVTSAGISPYNSTVSGNGFTIGALANVNVSTEVMYWRANGE